MSERVVDLLEIVEVHDEECAAECMTRGVGDLASQLLFEAAPVDQSREWIVVGEKVQMPFGTLSISDVAEIGGESDRPGERVTQSSAGNSLPSRRIAVISTRLSSILLSPVVR